MSRMTVASAFQPKCSSGSSDRGYYAVCGDEPEARYGTSLARLSARGPGAPPALFTCDHLLRAMTGAYGVVGKQCYWEWVLARQDGSHGALGAAGGGGGGGRVGM